MNVVYDCGATPRGSNIPSLVKGEDKITFNEDDHIDLLFISHFDEDHTNCKKRSIFPFWVGGYRPFFAL